MKFWWKKEPPPVEIVEAISAAGKDVMSRTLENSQHLLRQGSVQNGVSGSEDGGTPAPREERPEQEEASRSTRSEIGACDTSMTMLTTPGLRQQPTQRQFFQNELSTRSNRHSSGHAQSPPTSQHGSYQSSHPSTANPSNGYQTRAKVPLSMKSVLTPSSNLPAFRANAERQRDMRKMALGLTKPQPAVMEAGAGYEGANIYVRVLYSLQSGLPDEQDYALHHLLKISHERGDKYRFDAFQGLAEGLVEYGLKIASVFYDVDWRISWSEDDDDEPDALDGLYGTRDILDRLESFTLRNLADSDPIAAAHTLNKTTEAVLTLRNLCLLSENTLYLSRLPPLRDLLSVILAMPEVDETGEIKLYALDIAEHVSRYWSMPASDPLYIVLLGLLAKSDDRGILVMALQALCHISLELQDQNTLEGVPMDVLHRMLGWFELEDEELNEASLRFWYQYTGNLENLGILLDQTSDLGLGAFLDHLVRLLDHNVVTGFEKTRITQAIAPVPAKTIPVAPMELMEQFLRNNEPQRSTLWLKSVIEEDPNESITQLDIWSAYSRRFQELIVPPAGPLLQASDFIRLVSQTFPGATAQIVPDDNGRQKYLVRGIRPRHMPVDPQGQVFSRCLWKTPGVGQCGLFRGPRLLVDHVQSDHLGVTRQADGKRDTAMSNSDLSSPEDCFWANCRHFARAGIREPSLQQLSGHVLTHMPDTSSKSSLHQRHNRTMASRTPNEANASSNNLEVYDPAQGRDASHQYHRYHKGRLDVEGHPVGLALGSYLVLRNFITKSPRAVNLSAVGDADEVCKHLFTTYFVPLQPQLVKMAALNQPMSKKVGVLISAIGAYANA